MGADNALVKTNRRFFERHNVLPIVNSTISSVLVVIMSNPIEYVPVGLLWDGNDWSCGYNVLFGVLFNVWAESQRGLVASYTRYQ